MSETKKTLRDLLEQLTTSVNAVEEFGLLLAEASQTLGASNIALVIAEYQKQLLKELWRV